MKKSLLLTSLFLLPACATSGGVSAPPKQSPLCFQVTLPKTVTEGNYKGLRSKYAALPVGAPGRQQLRALLMDHLLAQADITLQQQNEGQAFKHFVAAARLFDAAEIYQGNLRHPQLSEMAKRLMARFAPQGDEYRVLLLLTVRMTLVPEDKALKEQFDRIGSWVDETQQLANGLSAKGARMIRVLERTAGTWPSRFLIKALDQLYIERQQTMAVALNQTSFRHIKRSFPALLQGEYLQSGLRVARLYLLVSEPYQGLQRLRELSGGTPAEEELQQLLEQAVAPGATIGEQIRLAEHLNERDRKVALRICRDATSRYPDEPAAYACAGSLAAEMKQTFVAVVNLEQALKLAPGQLTYAEALAKQYQRRLFEMIDAEELDEAREQMGQIERFYREAQQRFGARLKPGLSRVHYAIGHGFYNAGEITKAIESFEKSLASEKNPDALYMLASIALKQDRAQDCLDHLRRSEACPMSSPVERLYWQGRIELLRGQALARLEQTKTSAAALRRSIDAWQEWLSLGLKPEAQAEASIYQAQALFLLEERGPALELLDRAIDAMPDRKETYADTIVMLTTHGYLPQAMDALRRALGRQEVSEYLKTYCSFWILGMMQRAQLEPDPLALDHLRGLKGNQWYAQLAQVYLGKLTFAALEGRAKSKGQRAELYFYWADQLLQQGRAKEAAELWRKVVETEMMAFYEYDMAAHNLKRGVSPVKTQVGELAP